MINSFKTFYHVWMTFRLGIFNFTSIKNVLSENLDKLPFCVYFTVKNTCLNNIVFNYLDQYEANRT